MRKGKFSTRRSTGVKAMTMLLALVLAAGCVVGGTLAWLVDKTDPVTNTFTTADINITLTETKNSDGSTNTNNTPWSAKMIPGASYTKNPEVTVQDDSVDCILFVEFEENNNASTYLTYSSNLKGPDWTQGKGTKSAENPDGDGIPTNVWYRTVRASDEAKTWHLIADDKVTVNSKTVDKKYMDSLTAEDATVKAPELIYTAYAHQLYKSASETFTAAEAWANVYTLKTAA